MQGVWQPCERLSSRTALAPGGFVMTHTSCMLAAGTLITSRGSLRESVSTRAVEENGLGLFVGSANCAGGGAAAGSDTTCFAAARGAEAEPPGGGSCGGGAAFGFDDGCCPN